MASQQDASAAEFQQAVVRGLSQARKTLPCKYFYDLRGCELFDQICALDEYYLTPTELSIMRQNAAEIARVLGRNCLLIEFGSGSSVKTSVLLDNLQHLAAYVPVDIAGDHLLATADKLRQRYPNCEVMPVCADFAEPLSLPNVIRPFDRKIVYFPGSTMGNFGPEESLRLLEQISTVCGPGGGLLIGLDLQKDRRVIEAAYNDARGVTAEFNLNLLTRINRELGANFDLGQFRHDAFYDKSAGRIEMHLVSQRPQTVRLAGHEFQFQQHETICTEHSYKYNIDEFGRLAAQVGLQLEHRWTDSREFFMVAHFCRE